MTLRDCPGQRTIPLSVVGGNVAGTVWTSPTSGLAERAAARKKGRPVWDRSANSRLAGPPKVKSLNPSLWVAKTHRPSISPATGRP